MKKFYVALLCIGMVLGLLSSCNNDEKYIPTPPEVKIENISGITTCLTGDIIELKASVKSILPITLKWEVNGVETSKDSVYSFSSEEAGTYKIALTGTNNDGINADTLVLTVDKKISIPVAVSSINDIVNWTGEGDQRAVMAIQWVTSDNIEDPSDEDIHFLAWGYRWNSTESKTGLDMIEAIAKQDPLLYVIIENGGWGTTIKGFGYDGNNDGKIKITNGKTTLTQDDFVDGIYYSKGEDVDDMQLEDSEDFWMSGWYKAYTSYYVYDDSENTPDSFEYSNWGVSYRTLQNNSWDAWTFSTINSSMFNIEPRPDLLKTASENN